MRGASGIPDRLKAGFSSRSDHDSVRLEESLPEITGDINEKDTCIMVRTSTESIAHERSYYSVMWLFGAIIVGAGVILTTVGSFSLFSSWGMIGGSRYYWAAFLGLPLIAVGSAFTQTENLDASDEDLFVHRTKLESDEPARGGGVMCELCRATNPSGASFCNQCGKSLKPPVCVSCGTKMTPNARFCTHCGKSMVC